MATPNEQVLADELDALSGAVLEIAAMLDCGPVVSRRAVAQLLRDSVAQSLARTAAGLVARDYVAPEVLQAYPLSK